MAHVDLEQGRIGDRRLSFTDGEDVVVACFHSNTYEYYDYDNDECLESVSSVSNSEERVCRICQMEVGSYGQGLIELGCSCKDDLAFAHRQCAETWFKLKGNEVCEICHSEVRNLASGTVMIEEDEVVEEVVEDGEATVVEDGESWWKRQMVFIVVFFFWVSPFPIYFFATQR